MAEAPQTLPELGTDGLPIPRKLKKKKKKPRVVDPRRNDKDAEESAAGDLPQSFFSSGEEGDEEQPQKLATGSGKGVPWETVVPVANGPEAPARPAKDSLVSQVDGGNEEVPETIRASNKSTDSRRSSVHITSSMHLLLALLGGVGQIKRSWVRARKSAHNKSYVTCIIYAVVIIFGHLIILILPLALIAVGIAYVVAEGPDAQEIEEIVRMPEKQPYWMILFTSTIAAVSTNIILGPPRFRQSFRHSDDHMSLTKFGKLLFTIYLLYRTLHSWVDETREFSDIFGKQHLMGYGFPQLLRTLMLAMVASATGTGSRSQWGRYVDQVALLLVVNDYLNFKAAHQEEFLSKWKRFEEALKHDDAKNPILLRAMSSKPFAVGDIDDEDDVIEKAFAPSIFEPGRLVSLIQEVAKRNGPIIGPIWTLYIVILLIRCWTFGWIVALVYFPIFALCYFWVVAIALLFMILLRLTLVEMLMHLLTYCWRGEEREELSPEEPDQNAEKGEEREELSPEEPDKNAEKGEEREELSPEEPDQNAEKGEEREELSPEDPDKNAEKGLGSQELRLSFRELRLSIKSGKPIYPIDSPDKIEQVCSRQDMKNVTNAMASTGFLPGNFDRGVPFLLYTTWYSAEEDQLQRNYHYGLETVAATGITRDGWCFIITYAVVGKVMVDFMVVSVSRLLAGAGYWDSIMLTLTDRTFERFLKQFDYMDTFHKVLAWVQTIW